MVLPTVLDVQAVLKADTWRHLRLCGEEKWLRYEWKKSWPGSSKNETKICSGETRKACEKNCLLDWLYCRYIIYTVLLYDLICYNIFCSSVSLPLSNGKVLPKDFHSSNNALVHEWRSMQVAHTPVMPTQFNWWCDCLLCTYCSSRSSRFSPILGQIK